MIRTYRIVCWVVLGLVIYILLLPIISFYMSKAMPELWTCAFKKATGKPCPYCGITTDFKTILYERSFNLKLKNQMSLYLLIFFVLQALYRPFVLFLTYTKSRILANIKRLIFIEAAVHIMLFACFAAWSVSRLITIMKS